MDPVEKTFRAVADRTRLRILNLLRGGELCVGDLVHLLGVPQPTASRHLACLRNAGLVMARRNGLWGFYALSPASNQFHRRLLGCLDACPAVEPEFDTDTRHAAELRKAGGCCPELSERAAGTRKRANAKASAKTSRSLA